MELGYDFGVAKWFSIGLMGTYQKATVKNTFMDVPGTNTYDVSRIYVGGSFLFHYANSGRMDLYSGLRLGYKKWNFSSDIEEPSYETTQEELDNLGGIFSPFAYQVVLFGIRGYITENIGLHSEVLSIGTPHITSIGIDYRF